MEVLLQEFVDSRGLDLHIDREAGVLRGVKLLGLEFERPHVLTRRAGNGQEPVRRRVNVNHPKSHPLASRDYQDRLGLVRYRPAAGGRAVRRFPFQSQACLGRTAALGRQHVPENVGFSHNVQGRTVRQGDQTVVEAILKVHSVDLVADPATTSGLFEAARPERDETDAQILAACTLEDLRQARPDLVGEIETQSQSELGRLRRRVEELELQAALGDKRAAASRLLAEFHLPDPDQPGAGGEVVSESFLTALLAAPDETAMRALVAQRRGWCAAAAPVNAGRTGASRVARARADRIESAAAQHAGRVRPSDPLAAGPPVRFTIDPFPTFPCGVRNHG